MGGEMRDNQIVKHQSGLAGVAQTLNWGESRLRSLLGKKIYVGEVESRWALNEDGIFECQHEEYHEEEGEDYYGNKEYYYLCDDCDEVVEGDPLADRQADIDDFAYDEWRDNQL